jgi:tetratricopeptide (TPR) repeat protein
MGSSLYYAQALGAVGEFDQSSEIYRASASRAASVLGADSRLVGETLSAGVPMDIERGDLRVAIADARRAIEIYLAQAEPGSVAHAGRVRKLGAALLAARATGEAARRLEEAVRLAVSAGSKLEALHARGSFGLALAYLGRFDEAEDQLRQVLDHDGTVGVRARALAMKNLGTLLRLQGEPGESVEWLEQAVAAASINRGHRGDLAHAKLEIGLATLELDDMKSSQEYFSQAEEIFRDVQKQLTTPARADLLVGMARVQMHQRNYADALPLLQNADRFWRDFDSENRWAGEAALWLGRCQLALGRSTEAQAALSRAERILRRSPIPSDLRLLMPAREGSG